MAKLVVFYSRADENYFGGQYRFVEVGNTEKVAHMIGEATGAELFKIVQKEPYSPNYKRCIDQAMADKRANARPELVELPENLDGYDEIYLGYPNYWGDLPMAVYTFLEAFDWTGKTIYPFCTHEGSGMGRSEQDIKRLCPGAVLKKGLPIHGADTAQSSDKIAKWACS